MDSWILTIMVFFPVLGIVPILCLPGTKKKLIKGISLVSTAVPLFLAPILWWNFDLNHAWFGDQSLGAAGDAFQFVVNVPWIETFGIHYHVGVDGLSAPLVILTALISFVAVVASLKIEESVKGYFSLYLLLHVGMMGVFVALDLFLFYVFWELMLLPMYFLIGIWGGERKEYAAIKFFLYTLFGSIFLLLFVLMIYQGAAVDNPFSIPQLLMFASEEGNALLSGFSDTVRSLMFLGLFVAFAIKVPVFPFHTWLPDAHVEAPTPISVILAGILLKMGLYGIFRMNLGFFPDLIGQFTLLFALLGMINIIYGGLCALAQADFKKLVAYSSISHMGYCLLGIASGVSVGLTGAMFVMIAHGIVSPLMFLSVGVVYDRTHHRQIEQYGGLANVMPTYFGFTSITFFAALGLPGLISFVGEVLSLIGAFQAYPIITLISLSGILIGAGYCLWTIQRVFMGPVNEKYADLKPLTAREYVCMVPLLVVTVIFGVYPAPIINLMDKTITNIEQITF